MANKPINALENAAELTENDLIVLWQQSTNSAKKFYGRQLLLWLGELAKGKGGITEITGPVSSGLVDTYTIHFAESEETTQFEVHNGEKGDQGDQTYVWIKYAEVEPTSDSDISDIPGPWIGIYAGTESEAPTDYTQYEWYEFKGPPGDGVAYTVAGQPQGLSTTYTMYTAGNIPVGTFTVVNGEGGVSTVSGIAPTGDSGNVPLIVNSVSDLALTVGSATIADAYTALLVNQTLRCPATDFAAAQLPYNGTTYLAAGTVDMYKGENNAGWIEYHGYTGADYRMPISNGVPSGTWLIAGNILVESVTGPSVTVQPTGTHYVSGTFSCAKSGYTPIGIVGFSTNASDCCIVRMDIEGTDVHYNVRNVSANVANATPKADVLYVKN